MINLRIMEKAEIPNPDGGVRLLGIPTVQDRMIQQAITQYLVNYTSDLELTEVQRMLLNNQKHI